MSDITFRKVYDSAKDIINKKNPNAKISKLSSIEGNTINKIIGKETNQKVKSIKINFEGESILGSNVKYAYVEFIKKICANEDDFLKLKS